MQYYYAHTSHKGSLDALRRGVAYIKKQEEKTKLLVNDFRAGLVAKELGIDDSTTVETISDIDLVLELGDTIIIDSTEDLPKQFKSYCDNYKVFRVLLDEPQEPIFNEQIINLSKKENLLIDDIYRKEYEKKKRVVFFGGDSDYEKSILKHKSFFKELKADLILGHYFFVNYEIELRDFFVHIYESEEYQEIITTSSDIITTSIQCAIESKMAGANVIFITEENLSLSISTLFIYLDIPVLHKYDLSKITVLLMSI
jgi:hypothetical protein